jgi:hypothetical protein
MSAESGRKISIRSKETEVMPGALDILRKEMTLDRSNGTSVNDNVVLKHENILICGTEATVRRIYCLYGAYRIGWVFFFCYLF